MPGGSDYQGPPEALGHYAAVVEASDREVTVKGAKNPYTSLNGHMFSFLDAEGTMALRLSAELEEEFRSTYDSGPVMSYGSVMRGYSAVPSDLLSNLEDLVGWFEKAFDWIASLPPKPTKKGK